MTADVETEVVPPKSESPKSEKTPDAPERDEVERLDPQPLRMQLMSGTQFEVLPLKLRQFLALLRIVTRGASGVLSMGGLSSQDNEDFVRQLMALVIFAVPEAEEETVAFIKSIVVPANLTGSIDIDEQKRRALDDELDNPDLEDLVTIIEAVVEREGPDIRSLGNRLRSMFQTAQKMGLTNERTTG